MVLAVVMVGAVLTVLTLLIFSTEATVEFKGLVGLGGGGVLWPTVLPTETVVRYVLLCLVRLDGRISKVECLPTMALGVVELLVVGLPFRLLKLRCFIRGVTILLFLVLVHLLCFFCCSYKRC